MIRNPVLPGFNPDPSMLRVGDDFYIATSTFQWWPGVAIYHSRDLVHWRIAARPLARPSQLKLLGVPQSAGVYAPQLSHVDGLFYLVYTNVMGNAWPYMDCPNFLVTAPTVEGHWSEPVRLHARGFDPSLFHDEDGRSWLLSNEIDHRVGRMKSTGIVLQEYDRAERRLKGPVRFLSERDSEGPHLFKREGWYYLILAEGGTKYNHRAEIGRSRSLEGPYEMSPKGPLITSRNDRSRSFQKAGHASLMELPDGTWWAAHLASRPLPDGRCPLGRETCLQRIVWTEGWPEIEGGGPSPRDTWAAPSSLNLQPAAPSHPGDFSGEGPPPQWLSLREPVSPEWCSTRKQPGCLSLRGRQSLFSLFEQSLLGHRLESLNTSVEVTLSFDPACYRQAAGLALYYDNRNFFFCRISLNGPSGEKSLGIVHADGSGGETREPVKPEIALPSDAPVRLRLEVRGPLTRFFLQTAPASWRQVGPNLDTGEISDDHRDKYGFTGAFVALAAWDMDMAETWAHFSDFSIRSE